MYVPDGTRQDYPFRNKTQSEKFYAWGWLSSEYPFEKDKMAMERRQMIQILARIPVTCHYRGWHSDEGLGLRRSNGSIKFTHLGITYTAPAAVIYYIEKLKYVPPLQVMNALFEWNRTMEDSPSHIQKIVKGRWLGIL